MVEKSYDWEDGAELEEHTKKKHQILREYFREYLITRCKLPQQEKFRLAIVDGFSGGGVYECGSYGSPLIFLEVLTTTSIEINVDRNVQGLKPVDIQCLLVLNDKSRSVVEQLKGNVASLLIEAHSLEHINVDVVYCSGAFENVYPEIKNRLTSAKFRNVFFNLDQCGYSQVTTQLIRDIITSWHSPEVLLTFMIKSMLTYLSPNLKSNAVPLEKTVQNKINALLESPDSMIGKREWLAEAELIAFHHLKDCAAFVSPFSIRNPKGWQYWLMHFATSYRARQVYNDVLHRCGAQAHFGRSGLKMLSYDPQNEGQLYLFDKSSRQAAKEALYEDIPRFVAESGDALSMHEFYVSAYSETPAHSEDIHEMIMLNEDMEVITESGGKRRQANTIKPSDTLKLTSQKSFFFMFTGKKDES